MYGSENVFPLPKDTVNSGKSSMVYIQPYEPNYISLMETSPKKKDLFLLFVTITPP
jgi:hypothetical protein